LTLYMLSVHSCEDAAPEPDGLGQRPRLGAGQPAGVGPGVDEQLGDPGLDRGDDGALVRRRDEGPVVAAVLQIQARHAHSGQHLGEVGDVVGPVAEAPLRIDADQQGSRLMTRASATLSSSATAAPSRLAAAAATPRLVVATAANAAADA
jgi:hypothetical protein